MKNSEFEFSSTPCTWTDTGYMFQPFSSVQYTTREGDLYFSSKYVLENRTGIPVFIKVFLL